ncbi:hypothetical protein Axy10_069 [Achromobacter phage vB_AxyP_19-32_Axy10]|uniref:Uncharacterized protein n=1 Tax=Achromobacter phage vB_AxyP_19-32_Axy10 TaxID=2591041 RepID=A0A514CU33_9CAUD|nr:hypothetical protein KMC59_gp49 [Achromobacter phage vB_AxyP_19-32_Axy10]QDH83976.1 hypothetical protein Axy10_069 [Achromobacter phage vB_AxyP_19-32_Axy10]
MVHRRIRKKIPIPVEPIPEWRKKLKSYTAQIGSVGAVLYGVFEVLQQGLFAVPRHLLEKIPYGSKIALSIWASVMLVKLFRLKRKEK